MFDRNWLPSSMFVTHLESVISIHIQCFQDTNVLGFKGPRKMTILIPGIYDPKCSLRGQRETAKGEEEREPFIQKQFRPVVDKDALIERYKRKNMGDIVALHNKSPVWNEGFSAYK